MTHRLEILATASEAISGDRDIQYGPPAENMKITAEMMSSFLRGRKKLLVDLDSYDASMLLVITKIARAAHKPKDDNSVDGSGYFAIAAEVSHG